MHQAKVGNLMHVAIIELAIGSEILNMSRYNKIRADILSGKSDKNITEEDMRFFLSKIGAVHKRTTGSHFQYSIDNVPELINIQPKNGKIKPYQVKQIRNIVKAYKIGEGGTENGVQ